MIDGLFLADKSALEQIRHSERARSTATELLREGSLASGEAVALEVLYSSRNRAEDESTRARLLSQPWLVLDDRVSDRAMEVQRLLAGRGMHRMPVMDLLIAATAEVHGATVLHHDHDFDRIAAVTGQATRWIVPPGSGFGGDR